MCKRGMNKTAITQRLTNVAMIMGHDQERFLATPAEGFVGAEPLLCRAP